jgi:glycosyltransferase involved in cell wall biosynthesis
VRVLVFHGYLLRGTGSNVYTADLAAALVGLGHDVHLVCQERHADELDFVGAVGDWDAGELVLRRIGSARCTVYRPNIGGLLPVYVPDRYEGVEARPFPDLTEAELDAYLKANVRAVQDVVSLAKPELALANHLVMGPAILARVLSGAEIPYAVKVHGSALEYTVKPHPRFLPYAREGIGAASGVLVGSRHVAESLWATLQDPSVPPRTRLGPPGVDIAKFRPRELDDAVAELEAAADRVAGEPREASPAKSTFSRDPTSTARALRHLAANARSGPLIAFVGKLIVAKGIDLLLAAWPLVLGEVPSARLAVVGFGDYETAVERWIESLSTGNSDAVRELATEGRVAEDGTRSPLRFVLAFLKWLDASGGTRTYLAAARSTRKQVTLTGRLEHDELAALLPLSDAIVVPSTFPEAFGMVAVEAAACGALPISADHSGLAEVSRTLAEAVPAAAGDLLSFPVGPDAVQSIAARLITWLNAAPGVRDEAREALVQTAAARYSWEGVARGVIAAASGELDELALPS